MIPLVGDIYSNAADFICDTANHKELYVWSLGAITSLCLATGAGKAVSLVGRCTSLFMSSEILYYQLTNSSWQKIALTAIKMTSVCVGIMAVVLSSSSLLATSLLFDLVAQYGNLQLSLTSCNDHNNQNRYTFNSILLQLLSNIFVFIAIIESDPISLVFADILNIFNFFPLLFILALDDYDHYPPNFVFTVTYVLRAIFSMIEIYTYGTGVRDEFFDFSIPPLDSSNVEINAGFFAPINFRSDIFHEWVSFPH